MAKLIPLTQRPIWAKTYVVEFELANGLIGQICRAAGFSPDYFSTNDLENGTVEVCVWNMVDVYMFTINSVRRIRAS